MKILKKISVHAWSKVTEVKQMQEDDKKSIDDLPIFGRDIEDDWSWDREEKSYERVMNLMKTK